MYISFDFSMTKTLATPKLLVSILQYCLSNFCDFYLSIITVTITKKTFCIMCRS